MAMTLHWELCYHTSSHTYDLQVVSDVTNDVLYSIDDLDEQSLVDLSATISATLVVGASYKPNVGTVLVDGTPCPF